MDAIHKSVKDYYGAEKLCGAYEVIACPLSKKPPKYIEEILSKLHPAVIERLENDSTL